MTNPSHDEDGNLTVLTTQIQWGGGTSNDRYPRWTWRDASGRSARVPGDHSAGEGAGITELDDALIGESDGLGVLRMSEDGSTFELFVAETRQCSGAREHVRLSCPSA